MMRGDDPVQDCCLPDITATQNILAVPDLLLSKDFFHFFRSIEVGLHTEVPILPGYGQGLRSRILNTSDFRSINERNRP